MDTPYAIVSEASVPSTQDEAKARLGASDRPVLVVAESQTAGRGRTGARWETAPRAMAASLALHLPGDPVDLAIIPLVAGLAARSAVAACAGAQVSLKWPNDLVTEHGKVAGILVEASGATVVIGCGVNLWWPDPAEGATGLLADDPGPLLAMDMARVWATGVLAALEKPAGWWDRDAYREACVTIGRLIEWDPDGAGLALDVDDRGGLVVATDRGDVTLRSGAVRTVRPATLAADSAERLEPDKEGRDQP